LAASSGSSVSETIERRRDHFVCGSWHAGAEQLPVEFDPGSFRDRSRVFIREGRVFHAMDGESLATWRRTFAHPFVQQWVSQGQIVGTREVPAKEYAGFGLPSSAAGVLEHARIPFISYPYEWSFAMLRDAALLHLRMLADLIRAGLILNRIVTQPVWPPRSVRLGQRVFPSPARRHPQGR
jgi:hypothetical protein